MITQAPSSLRSTLGRIGVLAGGPSSERDISIKSGKAVYGALIQEGLDAVFLEVRVDVREMLERHDIDIAFIALHGRFGEDGTVQRMLEEARIPYTGSGESASRIALDKIASKEAFIKAGIPTPRYTIVEKGGYSEREIYSFGFPMVIKPRFEGSSIGLSVVRHAHGLKEALEDAFRYDETALVEEYIEGRELTVGVLGEKALPVVEIVARNRVYDYTAKYSDPDTRYLVPAPLNTTLSEKAMGLGLDAHRTLGCRAFSRADMMLDSSGRIFVLEVNTIPGMTERSLLPKAAKAAGLGFSELCVWLVKDAYEKTEKA